MFGNYFAQSFMTGTTDITLDSVSLMLQNSLEDPVNYTAFLYASSVSDTPSVEIANLGSKNLPAGFVSTSDTPLRNRRSRSPTPANC